MLKKVRIDKWLWSVRIFKTRTIATTAVKSGKVKIGEKPVKPSYQLVRGEKLTIGKNGFTFTFEVVDLLAKRVGAPIAQKCYIDHTPPEELNKYNDWFVGKRGVEAREKGTGRPTKRERREIDQYKEHQFYDWDEEDEDV